MSDLQDITLDDLTQTTLTNFRAWLEREYPDASPDDDTVRQQIDELTENPCPVATAAVLKLALHDNWLAVAEPDNPHEVSAVFCIRQNVVDHIAQALWDDWEAVRDAHD